jgi:hypothetical protein
VPDEPVESAACKRACSSGDRACASGAQGRRFDSYQAHFSISRKRLLTLIGAAVAVLVLAGVLYEFERPPALRNVRCTWRPGDGVLSAGDISNPSPWTRTFAIEPRFTFARMGNGVNAMHVYVSVPPYRTRHWSVTIDMHHYAGHPITSCTPYAYGASRPED